MYMTAKYELVEEEYMSEFHYHYTGTYSKKYTIKNAKIFDNSADAVTYAKGLGHAYVVQLKVGQEPNLIYETEV